MRHSGYQLLAGFVLHKCHKLPDVPAISDHLRSNWCPRILLVEQRNLFPQSSDWRLWLGLYSTRSKEECLQHLIDILGWRSLHSHLQILMKQGLWRVVSQVISNSGGIIPLLCQISHGHPRLLRHPLNHHGFKLPVNFEKELLRTRITSDIHQRSSLIDASTMAGHNHLRENQSIPISIRNFPRAGWRLIFGVEKKKGPWLEILEVTWCRLYKCFV